MKFLETIIQKKDEEITALKNELFSIRNSTAQSFFPQKVPLNENQNIQEILPDSNFDGGEDSDYGMDEVQQIKTKLQKRKTSGNNSNEHLKNPQTGKDPKTNSNLINSLKSVESGKASPSPQNRYQPLANNNFIKNNHTNNYNDYNNLNEEKSTTLNYNDTGVSNSSRNKVKEFLNEVKDKLDPKSFKIFIKHVKVLTDKTSNVNRKTVFEQVRLLFGEEHEDLYFKFEAILSPTSVK